MTDEGWIGAVLAGARPQAVAALLRWFRDLDRAEEAFQEACLRALKTWPRNGPAARRRRLARHGRAERRHRRRPSPARERPLPPEEALSDLSDAEAALVDGIDAADYRDDILRLLFICCHPSLGAAGQIALALRIVSGVPVSRIARAFLVSEAAMEQRITPRQAGAVAAAEVPFETPGAVERSERLAAVAAMVYLLFNEGYTTTSPGTAPAPRSARRRSGSAGSSCASSPRSPRSWGSSPFSCSSTPARRPGST
jgi:RNA polymerase sigma-70 factor (ECF subfamily)